jgi:glyoxylase-like metal-dependent hydrolase (beta-lactamase superfamily II)
MRIALGVSIGLSTIAFSTSALFAQSEIPEWCRALPRMEYRSFQRVPVSDPWFQVYSVAPDVFAIYEPHQAEETISYLIAGEKQALLFDTGMGISDIKKVTAELTRLPIVVVNSHTHNDHVGGNWQFDAIYGMDTDFTRESARGSRNDAQAEIASDQIWAIIYLTYRAVIDSQWVGNARRPRNHYRRRAKGRSC